MSDSLPLELQTEIMKKLPVKSLIQFRSVSKTWKSLIDDTHFISRYSSGQATHLLVSYDQSLPQYISFADDDTFPQHKHIITTPQSIIDRCKTIGSSHGLSCLYCAYHYSNYAYRNYKADTALTRVTIAFLWNPSVRKAVAVVVPNVTGGFGDRVYDTVIGFGVCRETVDPKIVKITYVKDGSDVETVTSIPWQVEVFALSTGVWRSLYNNLPRKSVAFIIHNQQVILDGVVYWLATDRVTVGHENKNYNLIISFDLTSEEFGEVHLPRFLADKPDYELSVSKLGESLVVVELGLEDGNLSFIVWVMEDGVPTKFTKLYNGNVDTPDDASVLGFRNNGEAIVEVAEDLDVQLVVYEPDSKHISDLGISGLKYSTSVCSYKETLLLLDRPYLTVYNGKETLKFEDDLSPEQLRRLLI